MAGQRLNITGKITTVTASSGSSTAWQKGADAIDVLGYPGGRFDFSLKVYAISPAASASATVSLYTSMYNDDDNANWIALPSGAFTAVTASNTTAAVSVTGGVLQYVKWKLVYTSLDLVSFEILGVAW